MRAKAPEKPESGSRDGAWGVRGLTFEPAVTPAEPTLVATRAVSVRHEPLLAGTCFSEHRKGCTQTIHRL